MSEHAIDISKEIIDWAINKVSCNENLALKLKKWKTSHKIYLEDIKAISKETNIPIGYFYLKTPPKNELNILNFKTIKNKDFKNPSINLKDTISIMESMQQWMMEYLIVNNGDKLHFVGSLKYETDIVKIADKIRQDLNIDINLYAKSKNSQDLFKKIRYNLKRLGIITMINGIVFQNNNDKLSIEEFRAFTLIDEYVPFIFINSNDSYDEKLFSLIHESVYIWLGSDDFFNDKKSGIHPVTKFEKISNEVSMEILMPNEIFIEKWSTIEEDNLEYKMELLAKEFKCSIIAVCRKALINKYVDYKFLKHIVFNHYNNYEKEKKPKGGNYYNTAKTRYDNSFLLALYNNVKEGKISFSDVYKFTNINKVPFLKLINKIKEN